MTKSTAKTVDENQESSLTRHSKIALLRMFMLKKQLDLLRQQQDCFGRNWLLPFNEKNQYDVTQTMKACRQMQSPFDLNLLCQEVGGPVRLFPDQVNLYKFTMKLKDMKKEKIEEKVNEYSIDQKFAG